jgi:hypothetical protein
MNDTDRVRIAGRIAEVIAEEPDVTAIIALAELTKINDYLREYGIDYPSGARGVADLVVDAVVHKAWADAFADALLARGMTSDELETLRDQAS